MTVHATLTEVECDLCGGVAFNGGIVDTLCARNCSHTDPEHDDATGAPSDTDVALWIVAMRRLASLGTVAHEYTGGGCSNLAFYPRPGIAYVLTASEGNTVPLAGDAVDVCRYDFTEDVDAGWGSGSSYQIGQRYRCSLSEAVDFIAVQEAGVVPAPDIPDMLFRVMCQWDKGTNDLTYDDLANHPEHEDESDDDRALFAALRALEVGQVTTFDEPFNGTVVYLRIR